MWYTTSKVVWSWVVVNIRCPGHSRGINYSALNQTLNFWKEKYIEIFKSVHEVLEVFCRHDNVVINTVGGNPPQSFAQNLLFAGRQHIFGTAWWFPCFGRLKYFHRLLGNFLLFQFQPATSYSQMCFQWTQAPWQKTTITRRHPLGSYYIFSPVKPTIQI